MILAEDQNGLQYLIPGKITEGVDVTRKLTLIYDDVDKKIKLEESKVGGYTVVDGLLTFSQVKLDNIPTLKQQIKDAELIKLKEQARTKLDEQDDYLVEVIKAMAKVNTALYNRLAAKANVPSITVQEYISAAKDQLNG